MDRNKRYAWCCGSITDYADWCSKERIIEAERVADTIVSACPYCIENISSMTKKEGRKINVINITQLLSKLIK
jgi:Fe-S oxidoreductase